MPIWTLRSSPQAKMFPSVWSAPPSLSTSGVRCTVSWVPVTKLGFVSFCFSLPLLFFQPLKWLELSPLALSFYASLWASVVKCLATATSGRAYSGRHLEDAACHAGNEWRQELQAADCVRPDCREWEEWLSLLGSPSTSYSIRVPYNGAHIQGGSSHCSELRWENPSQTGLEAHFYGNSKSH